jgi:sulfur carrier protein ThiS
MMRKLFPLALTALVLLANLSLQAGDVIDRIVATVNGRPILQSDWEDAISYEAFINGRRLEKLAAEDRKATLDRLIDQELLRQQLHFVDSPQATNQQLSQRVQEIRKLYPGANTEAGWQATLQRYKLNEMELQRRLAQQLDLARLIEAHFRPGIQIDSHSIEVYYQEKLVPELRKSGSRPLALNEVAPKIRELLTQERMNELLGSWLRNLRAESQIKNQVSATAAKGDQSR